MYKKKQRFPTGHAAVQVIPTHLSDSSEHLFFMRVHLSEGPNLCQVYVLTVAQGNNFIKGKNQVEAVFGDLILLQRSTIFRDLVREGKTF